LKKQYKARKKIQFEYAIKKEPAPERVTQVTKTQKRPFSSRGPVTATKYVWG